MLFTWISGQTTAIVRALGGAVDISIGLLTAKLRKQKMKSQSSVLSRWVCRSIRVLTRYRQGSKCHHVSFWTQSNVNYFDWSHRRQSLEARCFTCVAPTSPPSACERWGKCAVSFLIFTVLSRGVETCPVRPRCCICLVRIGDYVEREVLQRLSKTMERYSVESLPSHTHTDFITWPSKAWKTSDNTFMSRVRPMSDFKVLRFASFGL